MRTAPLLLACVFLAGPSSGDVALFEYRQPHMGTTVRVLLYAAEAADAERIAEAAFARIRELDERFSDYSATSELSRVSGAAGGAAIPVSADLFRVLEAAQRISVRTHGAFDVTIGPVSQLWRRARAAGVEPDPASLAAATRLVGYRRLHLSQGPSSARLLERGMSLDLGGIGKGFAADAALEVLVSLGARQSAVAIGGDIAVADPPPFKDGWDVAVETGGGDAPRGDAPGGDAPGGDAPGGDAVVETPGSSGAPRVRAIRVRRGAVSTSGDAEQFLDVGERHYSHIVDPRTGNAETGRVSATVRAPDGATADALATALKVLGPERGLPIVEQFPGTAALMVVDVGKSRRVFVSGRWRDVP